MMELDKTLHVITEEQTQKELSEIAAHKKYLLGLRSLQNEAELYYERFCHYRCYLTPWEKDRFNDEAGRLEIKIRDIRNDLISKYNKIASNKLSRSALLQEFKKLVPSFSDDLIPDPYYMSNSTLQVILSMLTLKNCENDEIKNRYFHSLLKEAEVQKREQFSRESEEGEKRYRLDDFDELEELKKTLNDDEDKDFKREEAKLQEARDKLIEKYKKIVSDRIFNAKLVAELKKVIDSFSGKS